MVELLAVLVIIGIMTAAAAPGFVRLLRDRRVNDAAVQMRDIFRVARARAMGRGSAVVVRWNFAAPMPTDTNPAGHLTVREAVVGAGGPSPTLPSTSCFGTNWADTSNNSRFVMAFEDRRKRFEPTQARLLSPTGSPLPYAEMCFTPRGRTFWRTVPTGVFVAANGVPRLEVINPTSTMRRYVLLLPNGASRVVTEI